VIFLGESLHCGYKRKLEEIGKIRFNSLNLTKKIAHKMEKNPQSLQPTKLKKEGKEKKFGTDLYMCAP